MASKNLKRTEVNNKVLPDTQGQVDTRNLPINKVGIKDILHPMIIKPVSYTHLTLPTR